MLGVRTVSDVDALPDGVIDLVFVCTPGRRQPGPAAGLRREGHQGGVPDQCRLRRGRRGGPAAEAELVALADELGILLAGPNGQGVVSTPAQLCAQIVAPYPPRGRIAVASQSGNFVSSFLNYARQTGVGISRAVSAGNAAAVTPADYLDWYADDAETAVSLAYVEGIVDGRALLDTFASAGASQAAGRRQGRRDRERCASRGQPHRRAGRRRQGVRRCVPPGRRHPRGHGRGGLRGRGHVRHAAVAEGAERRRADHRRRDGAS